MFRKANAEQVGENLPSIRNQTRLILEVLPRLWQEARVQEIRLDEKQSAKMYAASGGEWSPGA